MLSMMKRTPEQTWQTGLKTSFQDSFFFLRRIQGKSRHVFAPQPSNGDQKYCKNTLQIVYEVSEYIDDFFIARKYWSYCSMGTTFNILGYVIKLLHASN